MTAQRVFALAVLAVALLPLRAAPVPDIDALISYETQQVTAAGVTRIERWQERLVRRGDTVWTERVLPASAEAARASESAAVRAGHKHFDFDSAARIVQRESSGALRLRFVDRVHRIVVSVPKAEYGAVGFDGHWEAVAHVVPPAVIARMGSVGEGWRGEKAQGWTHRVRWSEALQMPLQLESQRDDGSVRRTVTITPSADRRSAALPWSAIAGYTEKEYDDFMD